MWFYRVTNLHLAELWAHLLKSLTTQETEQWQRQLDQLRFQWARGGRAGLGFIRELR